MAELSAKDRTAVALNSPLEGRFEVPEDAKVPGGVDRVLVYSQFLKQRKHDGEYNAMEGVDVVEGDLSQANLTTSIGVEDSKDVYSTGAEVTGHYPLIDLDVPAYLVPSSTPGNSHLYIDKKVPWKKYLALLDAMADAGLVEPGYVGASKARGFTAARLPWVKKDETPEDVRQPDVWTHVPQDNTPPF